MRTRTPVLEAMNEGLRALEIHPLLNETPTLSGLIRLEGHALAFIEAFGRLLERRVARNLDRNHPPLAGAARLHLRLHQPLTRNLRRELVGKGHLSEDTDIAIGHRSKRCLARAEHALDQSEVELAHVLMVQGLECLMQLLARRANEWIEALGGETSVLEARHSGQEGLLFQGLEVVRALPPERLQIALAELEMLFADGMGVLDEWRDTDPPEPPKSRPRRRSGHWETGDIPTGAA